MRYAGIILSLFVFGCNQKLERTPVVSIDPALQHDVDEFVREAANQGRTIAITDLVVRFSSDLGDYTLGVCYNYGGRETNVILINKNYWLYMRDISNRVVMFHELGHCVLNRIEHTNTGRARNGRCTATSIMHQFIGNDSNMYVDNWDAYMLELFTGVANEPPCFY